MRIAPGPLFARLVLIQLAVVGCVIAVLDAGAFARTLVIAGLGVLGLACAAAILFLVLAPIRALETTTEQAAALAERLNAKDRKMREMFAGISHDLRSPLTLIGGCLETVLARTGARADGCRACKKLLGSACMQVGATTRFVDAMLDLAQLDDPDYRMRCQAFSMIDLLRDVAAKFSLKARRSGMKIRVASNSRQCRVYADLSLMERVLDNLVGNAIGHAAGAKQLELRLDSTRAGIEVTIADDGPGLPADVRQRIAGTSPEAAWAERALRRGLGLTIVTRILQLHGSRLLERQTGFPGCRLGFALPRIDAPPGRCAPRCTAQPAATP